MAPHSSILVWRIPWTEEHGRQHPMGCKQSDTTNTSLFHSLISTSHTGAASANSRPGCLKDCFIGSAFSNTLLLIVRSHSAGSPFRQKLRESNDHCGCTGLQG